MLLSFIHLSPSILVHLKPTSPGDLRSSGLYVLIAFYTKTVKLCIIFYRFCLHYPKVLYFCSVIQLTRGSATVLPHSFYMKSYNADLYVPSSYLPLSFIPFNPRSSKTDGIPIDVECACDCFYHFFRVFSLFSIALLKSFVFLWVKSRCFIIGAWYFRL